MSISEILSEIISSVSDNLLSIIFEGIKSILGI
jgi:hypothetical protein